VDSEGEVTSPLSWRRIGQPAAISLQAGQFRCRPLFRCKATSRFNPDLRSGLALAGANDGGKGIMTAAEIGQLDLHGVALALIGACEGHIGEKVAGEGLISLQRAFHLAGVRKSVSAGWKVDESDAQLLLGRFTKNVFVKGVKPEAALRDAQRAFVSGSLGGAGATEPSHWAAWAISGSPLDK